jgi:pyruvate dehydrogenase E1 component alpha subunit
MVAVPVQDDLRRVLDDEGRPLPGAKVPELSESTLRTIFDTMLLVRVMDERMSELQRDGRLHFYMKSSGEEATHLAAGPLRASDWIFPSHRDQGAWFWRGYTIQQYIDQLFGTADDPAKGRQMPVHHSARWLNLVSISSPVGTQIPQAVGAAYGAKVLGKDDVSLVFFGEGASSTGEFHVGLNFAGVWKAPCVFLCRNNGWAISVPRERQTASRTFAQKALAYGIPGVRVDGNDVLAIWQTTSDAVERARRGGGPTLIEAITERRDPDGDPIRRLRNHLRNRKLWTESAEQATVDRYNAEITAALAATERKSAPETATVFDDVYAELPWNLREQRAYLLAQPRTKPPLPDHG